MRNVSEKEFEQKYNLYNIMIYSIALNYLHNEDDALDIMQDVFMKYLNSNKRFETGEYEKYWLIRVTINTSITALKSKWKTNVLIDNEKINSLNSEENKDSLRMREIISSLKNNYKEVIILYYYENYSINEIASMLNISLNAVKKRLERARNIIKKEYENG